MRIGLVTLILGRLLQLLGVTLLAPLAVAIGYGDGRQVVSAFALPAAACLVGGGLIWLLLRDASRDGVGAREGFACVTLGWVLAAAVGGTPFVLSGSLAHFTDAFFETMSGFTTTGASIVGPETGTRIEDLPHSILLWRSLTHWLGGMGIVVLFVAVLPALGAGGSQLYRAEVPSPTKDRISPRISDTAKILWLVYAGLSLVETALLWIAGMPLFDSVCHTFGTMATGGFSTKTASIGAYGPAIQWIVIVFMALAGVNFALHFQAVRGRLGQVLRDAELRAYGRLLLAAIGSVALALWLSRSGMIRGVEETLREAAFQVVSIVTTTGYATADFNTPEWSTAGSRAWPVFASCVLLGLMFIGACAGSTGGGMKVYRLIVLARVGARELRRLLRPRAVIAIKLGGKPVADDLVQSIVGFLLLWLAVFVVGVAVLLALGLGFLTAFSAVVACLSNIGPGLAQVGPSFNYGGLPATAKWLLSLCMLIGRLEVYSVLALLLSGTWKR